MNRNTSPSIFDAKLNRDDLEGAIDQALLGCDNAKALAAQAKATLKAKRSQVKAAADATFDKYPLL